MAAPLGYDAHRFDQVDRALRHTAPVLPTYFMMALSRIFPLVRLCSLCAPTGIDLGRPVRYSFRHLVAHLKSNMVL